MDVEAAMGSSAPQIDIPEEFQSMTAEEIQRRTRAVDNETKILKVRRGAPEFPPNPTQRRVH